MRTLFKEIMVKAEISHLKSIVLVIVVILTLGMSRNPGPPPEPVTIREAVELNYPDMFVGVNLQEDELVDLVNSEFGALTAGLLFNQEIIHPEPGIWQWEYSDAIIQNAVENDQRVYYHAPVSPQCSRWAKEDHRTPAELETMLREFVTAFGERYNDHHKSEYWEVINEALTEDGTWTQPKPGTESWENPWPAIGTDPDGIPSYIRMALGIAQDVAPDMKIGWNHGQFGDLDWQVLGEVIPKLKSEGYRIDFIGFQGHVPVGSETPANLNKLKSIINTVHELGMEFFITEMDVYIPDDSQAQLDAQAKTYKKIIETVLDAGGEGISFWSIADELSWRPHLFPGLFDEDLVPKPAHAGVMEALSN